MRIFPLMLSVAVLGLTGPAIAAAPPAPGQCRADWTETGARELQCQATLDVTRQSVQPYDTPVHHVMTKQEVRAELDAIKVDRAGSQPVAPSATTLLSSRN